MNNSMKKWTKYLPKKLDRWINLGKYVGGLSVIADGNIKRWSFQK